MTRDRCQTCRYFRPLGKEAGECRFAPPKVPAAPAPGVPGRFGAWPLVLASAWCGQYQQKGG